MGEQQLRGWGYSIPPQADVLWGGSAQPRKDGVCGGVEEGLSTGTLMAVALALSLEPHDPVFPHTILVSPQLPSSCQSLR